MAETSEGTELRAYGPLEMLDAALLAVRRGGGDKLLRALGGGAPLALLALGIYYLERVEGVRTLRPLFAVLLVLAFWLRSLTLSRVARDYALAIRPTLPLSENPPRTIDVLCTASVVGIGLWAWLWPIAAMAMLSPFAVAAVLPFVALRGAVAPSWLARASCARERGLAAFGQAFDDTAGMRGVFLIVELLALFGTIGLFGNLWALLSFALLLGHSMLGLDVAFVSSFLSPDNTFVLLANAALALLLFEPLRAAISAQAFVDARSRRDGADLHAAVDAAIERSAQRPRRAQASVPPGAAALAALGLLLAAAPSARADEAADLRVRSEVEQILSGPEFREFVERDNRRFTEWLEKLFEKLFGKPEAEPAPPPPRTLPELSPWVPIGLAALALLLIALYVSGMQRARPPRARKASGAIELPSEAQPASVLDDAAALAARGDMRGALRALYVATLLMLDRKRMIEFEPWKTNGQYIRAMPPCEARQLFAAFTRIFDHKWYGHEPATAEDYQACRRLAERIGGALDA